MAVNIYYADISGLLRSPGEYEKLMEHLSDERCSKTLKIKHLEGRCRSVGAGMLLDKALSVYGLKEKDMKYTYGKNGKPSFAGHPEIFFNLSHSGSRVMCILADVPVGCDVEKIGKGNPKIAKRFFTEPENAELEAAGKLNEQLYKDLFYTYWTLKECYVKCTGQGLGCPFDSFAFTKDGRCYKIKYRTGYKFINFADEVKKGSTKPRYAYAVCLETKNMPEYSIEYTDICK
ncbi:MAG: 4'-phosphopantetheinyl transferase superfamily protein [Lachnospiraceae bacterium]|nr:4'-phosphopantetheinyl transferase superfamily protein [Lachnospiraceae bacterium]